MSRWALRKLVFVNSHGGNEEIMDIVARELARARQDVVREDELDAVRSPGWDVPGR